MTKGQQNRPTLGPLLSATLVVPDLATAAEAWQRFGYEQSWSRPVSESEAAAWDAPATAGAPQVRLDPPDGTVGGIRLVEDAAATPPPVFRSHGWAAVELVVADVEREVDRLVGSAFRLVMPPVSVGGSTGALRAAQLEAPGGAGVYLTEVHRDPPGFSLPRAVTPVGRMFICVLATADLEADRAFLEERFAVRRVTDHRLPIRVINHCFGMPTDTTHRLSTLQLRGHSALEIDDYPAAATPRPCRSGHLPPGIAMVSAATKGWAGPELVTLPGGARLRLHPAAE